METSTFESEMAATQIAKELIVRLQHKLRMFGVLIDGPTDICCDNQEIVKNTSLPESTLAKKHNAVNCHAVHQAVAAGVIRAAQEDTETRFVHQGVDSKEKGVPVGTSSLQSLVFGELVNWQEEEAQGR